MKQPYAPCYVQRALTACALYIVTAYPVMATGSATADVLCDIVEILQGPLGIGAATLAVASVGTAAILGRASWGMAITVAIGIAVLFGAASVTFALTSVASPCIGVG